MNSNINKEKNIIEFLGVLDALSYGVMLINTDQTIYFANKRLKKIIGINHPEGLERKYIFSNKVKVWHAFNNSIAHEIRQQDIIRKNGNRITILKTSQVTILNNRKYIIEAIIDMTNMNNTEQNLLDYTMELNGIIKRKNASEQNVHESLVEHLKAQQINNDLTMFGSKYISASTHIEINNYPNGKVEDENTNQEDLLFGKKILIAEDDFSNYLFLKTVLSKAGCELIHASNGEEALKMCISGTLPDLVIMDLKMPIMDGYEATKKIKEIHNHLPIIAHSAYVLDNEREKAIASGCVGYIPKPVKKQQLLESIARYFKENNINKKNQHYNMGN